MILSLCLLAAAAEEHSSCRRWAHDGECEANPGYMLASCSAACEAHAAGTLAFGDVYTPPLVEGNAFLLPGLSVSPRLTNVNDVTVRTVNDWHFAMMNDFPRNELFRRALEKAVRADSTVLDIGSGSGMLAMIAARLGPQAVIAVEANGQLLELAERVAEDNGLRDQITFVKALSSDLTIRNNTEATEAGGTAGSSTAAPPTELPQRANVLVTETLGTLLLSESTAFYIEHAREKLLTPDAAIIPARGVQYVVLIESHALLELSEARAWGGFDLSRFNALRDTDSLTFSNSMGLVRMSTTPHTRLTGAATVFEIDFGTARAADLRAERTRTFDLEIVADGTIHAAMTFWEAALDKEGSLVLSTDPQLTKDNIARDRAWGHGVQFLEDMSTAAPLEAPRHLQVRKGDVVQLTVTFTELRTSMQFRVAKAQCDPAPASMATAAPAA